MHSLYEAKNGWTGESYVRVYVWATSEDEARKLAEDKFIETHSKYKGSEIQLTFLFSANTESFASEVSDEGFIPPSSQ